MQWYLLFSSCAIQRIGPISVDEEPVALNSPTALQFKITYYAWHFSSSGGVPASDSLFPYHHRLWRGIAIRLAVAACSVTC